MCAGETVVLVFARAPVPGAVKRRLTPALGARGAAMLHRRMVVRTVETATAAAVGPVELWGTPTSTHPFFLDLAARSRVTRHRQRGADLGARMQHAFNAALARDGSAILVGTDCPGLEPRDFQEAAGRLAGGRDAVLLPAADGGYTLLGLRRVTAELFRELEWGRETVYAATCARLIRLGWRWSALRTLPDIDRPEDLVHLPDGMRDGLARRREGARKDGDSARETRRGGHHLGPPAVRG